MNTLSQKVGTFFLASTILMTVGCSKDDDPVTPTPTPAPSYTVPSTYAFVNAGGESTVSFSGQQQRLDMLSELTTYMKTGNTADTTLDAAVLKQMYANDAYTWSDANGLGMTGSSKQLKSKTAFGDEFYTGTFEAFMDGLALTSVSSVENADEEYGTTGVWTNGSKSYLMDAQGQEYTQFIEKGLMCAVFMNQMTQNYLANIADDDNVTIEDGKTYTAMQHHWDEAYGYFTSEVDYPTNGTNRFWGKYADKREAVLGSKTKIAEAFRTGRAAIDNNDFTVRDAQKDIINTEMYHLCAGTGIYYLKAARANITNPTLKNHELSEAAAFIRGLAFHPLGADDQLTFEGAYALFLNFETVTVEQINQAIDIVASTTGLTEYVDQL
jgi:hypothetical protein